VLSTLAFALLFLALSAPLGAAGANAAALALTAVANTAANRRFTFGLRGRRTSAATTGAVPPCSCSRSRSPTARSRILHAMTARPPRWAELAVLVARQPAGHRHPLRGDEDVGVHPPPPGLAGAGVGMTATSSGW